MAAKRGVGTEERQREVRAPPLSIVIPYVARIGGTNATVTFAVRSQAFLSVYTSRSDRGAEHESCRDCSTGSLLHLSCRGRAAHRWAGGGNAGGSRTAADRQAAAARWR